MPSSLYAESDARPFPYTVTENGLPDSDVLPPPNAIVPAAIGRLRIREELGRGGMGVVYRAEDPSLRQDRAVKLMHPHLIYDGVSKERFLREARAAAAIDHTNVVPVFEVGECEGRLYFVMPMLKGMTLAAWARDRGPLPPLRWLRLGAAVPRGLSGFILEMLAKKPDDRPPSAGVVRDTLREIDTALRSQIEINVSQSSVTIPPRREQARPRHRGWIGTTVLLTVLAGAAAAYLLSV